jgi:sugar phosphate permease
VWLAALVGVAQTTSRFLLLGSVRGDHDHWLAGIVPLSLACFLALGGAYSALAFVVLYGAGNGIITVLRGVAVVERVSVEDVGAINGLISFASSVGRATGPWLLGTLWSPLFGYASGAIVLMIVGFVAAFALALARPTKTKSS